MEKNVNKVTLCGNAGINPVVLTLNENKRVAKFDLATTESYKNQSGEWEKNTTWHKIVMWNRLADQVQTLIRKGTQISLTGKIVYRNYTDDKGMKHYYTEIFASSFETVKVEKKENVNAA